MLLRNSVGQVMLEESVLPGTTSVQLLTGLLPQGLYMLEMVYPAGNTYYEKVMIVHW